MHMIKYRYIKIVFALTLIISVSACGSNEKELDDFKETPVEVLYNNGMDLLKNKRFKEAAEEFDEVERQHPYSVWATKAQLMAAYSYYEGGDYDDAIIAANRFVQLHPGNKDAAYAYYIRALSYYEQISDVHRDQEITIKALDALKQVVLRFPKSEYAKDAKLKIDLAKDHLAGKEMSIGRYYLKQKQYLPAINRFRKVVEEHQTTSHVPEALHRLVEAYSSLGLLEEARKSAAVLGHNFPGSEWYQLSYWILESGQADFHGNKERTWLGFKF